VVYITTSAATAAATINIMRIINVFESGSFSYVTNNTPSNIKIFFNSK